MDSKIGEIRSRWMAAAIITDGWGRLPAARRERALAEIEEMSRETQGHAAELASDLGAAVAALDVMGRAATFDLVAQAVADIHALLQALEQAAPGRR